MGWTSLSATVVMFSLLATIRGAKQKSEASPNHCLFVNGVIQVPNTADIPKRNPSDIKAQIDALRDQVATLVEGRASPIDDAARVLNEKARDIGGAVREHAETLSTQVREKPIAALLIAAGIGYVIGRLVR